MGWLTDKLLALFMEKSARQRIEERHRATKKMLAQEATEQEKQALSELDAAIHRMRERQVATNASGRDALIRQAMAVHRSKQGVLADLTPEDREKLMVMAAKAFLAQVPDRKH